jgi:hypothetical protein
MVFGQDLELTFGTGSDHGLCDVYLNGVFWGSVDTYASTSGEKTVAITLDHEDIYRVNLRNRADHHLQSTGYRLRFKQLTVWNMGYDLQTISYVYDGLSRLTAATYYPDANLNAMPFRDYAYTYDRAGNRLSESIVLDGGMPTVTNFTYDAANRLTSGSITYDTAGRMISDGTNIYTWDGADRLMKVERNGGLELHWTRSN